VRPEVIAEFVAGFGKALEVCCGYYLEVARILKEWEKLLCVCDRNADVKNVCEKYGIEFIQCDVESPGYQLIEMCRIADVIYAIRPPPELWGSIISLAEVTGCRCVIRPMSCEFANPAVSYRGERFLVF